MGDWKKNRKTVATICKTCSKTFEKIKTEYNRTEKLGKNHYCSRNCCGKDNIKKTMGEWFGNGNTSHLKNIIRSDEFTGFREFLRRARNRDKLGDLTLEDIKETWNNQNGICPYTGIKLTLPTYSRNKKNVFQELASLDRIDSNKPYEKGNIVFVCASINLMKNSMTEEETIAFCKKIALFWYNK
jgi:hypothetical protein